VVIEKTPEGGETLKITITTSNTGDRRRQAAKRGPLFCAPWTVECVDEDGPGHHRIVWAGLADGLAAPKSIYNHVPSNLDDQN
jgi:hypothetical protein